MVKVQRIEFHTMDIIYTRIGTKYYKVIDKPKLDDNNEIQVEKEIVPWNKTTIVDDHGREFLNTGVHKFYDLHELSDDIAELYYKLPKSKQWRPRSAF